MSFPRPLIPFPRTTTLDSQPEEPTVTVMAPVNRLHDVSYLLNGPNDSTAPSSEPSAGPPPSPPYTLVSSSANHTPYPDTPLTGNLPTPQKPARDAATFIKAAAKQPIHFFPFEYQDHVEALSPAELAEMLEHHQKYEIRLTERPGVGLIADFARHIPYSSDKKGLQNLGRDSLETYTYVFKAISGEHKGKEQVVLWDYQTGFFRLTPCFRSLDFNKTTPNRALNATEGLKDLSYSLTGGSLIAQGYWLPMNCARALCLTFCYEIRWMLTPLFGPAFARECLRPEDPNFGKFKIAQHLVVEAQRHVRYIQSWARVGENKDIPRSVPAITPAHEEGASSNNGFWEGERPVFTNSSPFTTSTSTPRRRTRSTALGRQQSPDVSPRTRAAPIPRNGWNSVNNGVRDRHEPVHNRHGPVEHHPQNDAYGTPTSHHRSSPPPLSHSLLRELFRSPYASPTPGNDPSYANGEDGVGSTPTRRTSTRTANNKRRRVEEEPVEYTDNNNDEDDDERPLASIAKRQRRQYSNSNTNSNANSNASSSRAPRQRRAPHHEEAIPVPAEGVPSPSFKGKNWTKEDFEAAGALIALSRGERRFDRE